jgi:hypothetical protein
LSIFFILLLVPFRNVTPAQNRNVPLRKSGLTT